MGVILNGPEFLEGLPLSLMSRSPCLCYIHSLKLTASPSCPFHSFFNRSDFILPSVVETAFGICGRKQAERIVLLK